MMVGGTGNDAIVGGQNGGLLLGNAGNDMIYAIRRMPRQTITRRPR